MPRAKSNLATVPPAVELGAPSSRLQNLIDGTKKRDPYPLTDAIVVMPPNRNARKRLDQLAYSLARAQTLMQDALRRTVEEPPQLGDEPSDEEPSEHEAALQAWEARVTAASEEFREHSSAIERDNEEWTKTLLGDSFDDVNEFLGEQEPELYDAAMADIRDHMQSPLGGPDTGVCPKCGTVLDADAVGKDTESST